MQSETGFPSSHQLKSYVASKSRLELAARAVLSADAGLLVTFTFYIRCTCTRAPREHCPIFWEHLDCCQLMPQKNY